MKRFLSAVSLLLLVIPLLSSAQASDRTGKQPNVPNANSDPRSPRIGDKSPTDPSAKPVTNAAVGSTESTGISGHLASLDWKPLKYTLENGLEVILVPDASLPRVAVSLWYRVGPSNQPEGRSGFAHLFEHLMFEGSKYAGRNFDVLLEQAGATNVNGTTSWDRTNFFETVPSNHLELALWLESDRMGFLLDAVTQERLDVQRRVVLNERRQSYENAPYGKSYLAMINALFPPGHPFHDAVIGSVRDLEEATLSDVRGFFERYYAPSNASLTIAGSFDAARTKELVQRYFGALGTKPALPRPKPPCSLVEQPHCQRDFRVLGVKPQTLTVAEDVALPQVAAAWATPPAFTDPDLALELAARILADGKTSRLYRKLVVEKRLASSVSAWVDSTATDSMFQVSATGTSTGDLDKLEQALLSEVEKLIEEGPSEAEVSRALHKELRSTLSSLQVLNGPGGESGKAGIAQVLNHYLGEPGLLRPWLNRLEAQKPAAVHQALRDYLNPERRVVVRTVNTSVLQSAGN